MPIQSSGNCPSRIMIVGDFPAEADMQSGEPFTGYSGNELSKMLAEVGIYRSSCFLSTVIKERPPGGLIDAFIVDKKRLVTPDHRAYQDKWVLPVVTRGINILQQEIALCQPNIIIAVGSIALWALTGKSSIESWRGSVMECSLAVNLNYKPKVIPTYSIGSIFKRWNLRRIVLQDLRRAAYESTFREYKTPDYKFIVKPSFEEALLKLAELGELVEKTPLTLAVDIETRMGHIACIGLAWNTLEALCIPLLCTSKTSGYWSVEEETKLMFALYSILTHPNCSVVGQNFIYDAQYFYRHLCYIPNIKRDTMIGHHALFSNMPKSLDFLSSMYCATHLYWKDEGKEWDASMDEQQLWRYNCKDCVITLEIDAALQRMTNALKMQEVFDFQQSLIRPVLDAMNKGLRVDFSKKELLAEELAKAIEQTEQWFISVLGHPFNPRSSAQMKKLFYEDLQLKPEINRKTGAISCDDEALHKLALKEPLVKPLVDMISNYRSLGVFLSTFVQAPVDVDSRMRCYFNIAGTDTYRFSSSQNAFGSGMNLQNIPKNSAFKGLEKINLRELFLPDEGKMFFDIDLASADLRIVVWESDEQEMKAMLKAGLDPYTEIAKEFYCDPSITKKDPRRQIFKSFVHGTNYLGTAKGLAERLGLSVKEAEKTQKWYFQRFPKIKQWQENLIQTVKSRQMVRNVFGYKFNFFDRIEGTTFNQAAAWIPQSTVACLINRAFVNIHRNLPEVQVLIQVHDSLAGQFAIEDKDRLIPLIVQNAEIALPYENDPLIIPVGVQCSANSWGACG